MDDHRMHPPGDASRRRDASDTPDPDISPHEANHLLRRNIQQLVRLFEHATDDEVATTVIEAVRTLLGRLSNSQRPPSRPGTASSRHDESSDPPPSTQPKTLSRKRRRQPSEPVEDALNTASARDVPATSKPTSSSSTRTASAPATKTRRTRGADHSSSTTSTNMPAALAISSDCGPTELSQIRAKFQSELLRLSPPPRRDKSTKAHGFTPQEAADVTEFFFDEVMGPQSLHRLQGLVKSYVPAAAESRDGDGSDEDAPDAGAIVRLKKIAHDKHAPLVIRRFFGTFHHQQRFQNTNPVMLHLQQIIDSRELLHNYERVKAHVEEGDIETINYLTGRGMTVGVGRGWSSVAIDFLADRVQIKRSTFVNMCERAKGINTMVEQFGEGILPLLPPGTMHRLRRYGAQKMEPAYVLLKQHVHSFQPMCDLTRQFVYAPFLSGQPTLYLDASHLVKPKSQNFLDILTDAANVGATTQTTEEGDVTHAR